MKSYIRSEFERKPDRKTFEEFALLESFFESPLIKSI